MQKTDPLLTDNLQRGVDAFWNMKLKEAEELLEKEMNSLEPPGWICFAYHAMVAWARAIMTEDKEDIKVAFARMDKSRDNMQKVKGYKVPDAKDTPLQQAYILAGKLMLAKIVTLDASLKFKTQAFVKGAYNFRKAWKYYGAAAAYRDACKNALPHLAELSAGIDAGVGFFLFIVSVVPSQWLWIIEAIGFEGNRTKGVELMTKSAETKCIYSYEAWFHLIWITAFFWEKFDEAEKVAEAMIARFPTAGQIKYLLGYVYRKQGKLDEAQKMFIEAHDETAVVRQFQLNCHYEQGYNHFLNMEWHQAIGLLQKFYDTSTIPGFRTYCAYMLGMSYEMLFQNERAVEMMKKVPLTVRKGFDYDETADRRAKKFLSNKGLSMFDRKFFAATLHNESCRPDDTLDTLETAASLAEKDEERALVAMLRGSAHQKKKNCDEAMKFYNECLALEKVVKHEIYVIPHALAGLGECQLALKQYDKAEKSLNRAKSFKEYDFASLTQWRCIKGLETLAAINKKP